MLQTIWCCVLDLWNVANTSMFWSLIKNSCSVKVFTFPPCNSVSQLNRLRVCFHFSQERDYFLTVTMKGAEPGRVWACIGCCSLPCPFLTRRGGRKGRGCLDLNFQLDLNHNTMSKKLLEDTDGTVDTNVTKQQSISQGVIFSKKTAYRGRLLSSKGEIT